MIIIIAAFICEYGDSTLGAGYGTILSPLLLIVGFEPLQIVPAILVSEFCTGFLGAFAHHRLDNMRFCTKDTTNFKIVALLGGAGIISSLCGAFLVINISKKITKSYIGFIVILMGILLITGVVWQFTWRKIIGLGLFASFNKIITGGGYGPVVVSGQLLSNRKIGDSVATTLFAEGLMSMIGICIYSFVFNVPIITPLTIPLTIGAIMSVPLAGYSLKRAKLLKIEKIVGIFCLGIGCFTILKVLL